MCRRQTIFSRNGWKNTLLYSKLLPPEPALCYKLLPLCFVTPISVYYSSFQNVFVFLLLHKASIWYRGHYLEDSLPSFSHTAMQESSEQIGRDKWTHTQPSSTPASCCQGTQTVRIKLILAKEALGKNYNKTKKTKLLSPNSPATKFAEQGPEKHELCIMTIKLLSSCQCLKSQGQKISVFH